MNKQQKTENALIPTYLSLGAYFQHLEQQIFFASVNIFIPTHVH